MSWTTLSATLLCLFLAFFLFKLVPVSKLRYPNALQGTTSESSSLSLHSAYNSFLTYPTQVSYELSSYCSKINSLRGAHRRWARVLGYGGKISALSKAGQANAKITKAICDVTEQEFSYLLNPGPKSLWDEVLPLGGLRNYLISRKTRNIEMGRVKEALKHLVRDWSAESQRERDVIFTPILEELEKIPVEQRANTRVLVPGSGLGRLGFEIARMGFDTTAIEISYFMTLPLLFLLSPSHTHHVNEHTLYPYAHWWSHQRSNESTFREVKLPDVVPQKMKNWHLFEGDFLGLGTEDGRWDIIVTLFFIDTASNIMSYLQHIHHLLCPSGKWINLGPLLYANAIVELSLDEVVKASELIGFKFVPHVDNRKTRTIPSEYTSDREAMMKWVYQAEFWVARKVEDYELITL